MKCFTSSWLYDRVSNGVAFDEPMNYFGTILGYDELPMPINANSTSSWGFELIRIRMPDDEMKKRLAQDNRASLPDDVYTWKRQICEKRTYPFIKGAEYDAAGCSILNTAFAQSLSMRDPFNVKGGRSGPCVGWSGYPCESSTLSCTSGAALESDFGNYALATCTVKGAPDAPVNALMSVDDNVCHLPWGKRDMDASTVGQPMDNNGIGFCQGGDDQPTFSSLWINVVAGKAVSGNIGYEGTPRKGSAFHPLTVSAAPSKS